MSDWNRPYVMDNEAFQERLAIMLESNELTPAEASSQASESAYKTPFSIVATAAIRGDWEPTKAMCRVEKRAHGEEHAMILWRAIQEAVKERKELG